MTFTEKDKELITSRVIFGEDPYADDLPRGSVYAYASVRFGELSNFAKEFLSDTICQSNRAPIDGDEIRINWTDDGEPLFYACDDAGEWYAGSDLDDDVLREIYRESIATRGENYDR